MSEAEQPSPPEEEKRPFQFGLSTMFLVMTIWGVFLALAATFGLYVALLIVWMSALVYACYRKRYRWAGGLVVLFFVVGLLLPAFSSPRGSGGSGRRGECLNNLKQIGLALANYEDEHGSFPPAYIADESGKPMHSWRVLLLPEMDRNDIYVKYNFDEPWDGPNNSKLHDEVMRCYTCPSDVSNKPGAKDTDTSYVVVVGPNTMFPEAESVRLKDSVSQTLMVVEVANSSIHWMEPRDLHITQMAPTINPKTGQGISSQHPGGANAAFGDGHVEFLDAKTVTPKQLQALLTIGEDEEIDGDER